MADEYILKQDAMDKLKALEEPAPTARHLSAIFDCEDAINSIKPADVVKVVRCKDCKNWHNGMMGMNCSWDANYPPHENDFCSNGERKS